MGYNNEQNTSIASPFNLQMAENIFQFYEVGGCVRDSLLGIPTKDIDFSVVAKPGVYGTIVAAFAGLEQYLTENKFHIFESRLQFQTIRALVPEDHPLRKRTAVADFVLARLEGPYSDGRHPDWVAPGTLEDDIFRRDFTVNALCRAVGGEIIDLVGGLFDLEHRQLRFVGDPEQRIREDGLRVLRAFRFMVTKKFTMAPGQDQYIYSDLATEMLYKVSINRVRDELHKMFLANSMQSIQYIMKMSENQRRSIFRENLWLMPTLKLS